MTISKERVEELEEAFARLDDAVDSFYRALSAVSSARNRDDDDSAEQSVLIDARLEIAKAARSIKGVGPALLSAYRTREAALAECGAWRRKAGKFGEITQTWYTNGSMFRVPIQEADTTDAARREEEKGR